MFALQQAVVEPAARIVWRSQVGALNQTSSVPLIARMSALPILCDQGATHTPLARVQP